MTQTVKVYTFEWSALCPCGLEFPDGLPVGFTLVGGTKGDDGKYSSPPELHITEDVVAGEYEIQVVLVDVNNVKSNDPRFGGDGEIFKIGPLLILEDSFMAVATMAADLQVQFQNIGLCEGGCNAENKFIKL